MKKRWLSSILVLSLVTLCGCSSSTDTKKENVKKEDESKKTVCTYPKELMGRPDGIQYDLEISIYEKNGNANKFTETHYHDYDNETDKQELIESQQKEIDDFFKNHSNIEEYVDYEIKTDKDKKQVIVTSTTHLKNGKDIYKDYDEYIPYLENGTDFENVARALIRDFYTLTQNSKDKLQTNIPSVKCNGAYAKDEMQKLKKNDKKLNDYLSKFKNGEYPITEDLVINNSITAKNYLIHIFTDYFKTEIDDDIHYTAINTTLKSGSVYAIDDYDHSNHYYVTDDGKIYRRLQYEQYESNYKFYKEEKALIFNPSTKPIINNQDVAVKYVEEHMTDDITSDFEFYEYKDGIYTISALAGVQGVYYTLTPYGEIYDTRDINGWHSVYSPSHN